MYRRTCPLRKGNVHEPATLFPRGQAAVWHGGLQVLRCRALERVRSARPSPALYLLAARAQPDANPGLLRLGCQNRTVLCRPLTWRFRTCEPFACHHYWIETYSPRTEMWARSTTFTSPTIPGRWSTWFSRQGLISRADDSSWTQYCSCPSPVMTATTPPGKFWSPQRGKRFLPVRIIWTIPLFQSRRP